MNEQTTMDPTLTTAEAIMAVSTDAPWALFATGTVTAVQRAFHDLARQWHPDVAGGDPDVFRHLTALRDAAIGKIKADAWRRRPERRFEGVDGRTRIVRYAAELDHAAGVSLVGRQTIAHVLNPDFAELGAAGETAIGGIVWHDEAMRERLAPTVPEVRSMFATVAGEHVMVIKRFPDMIRLRDLLDHLGGRLEPRHAAWILRRTASIACLLEFSGLHHGDISPDSVWVAPATHGVSLLGGWWFAGRLGEALRALPARTVDVMPSTVFRDRVGSPAVTLEGQHLLARELLGDPAGTRRDQTVPEPLRDWARLPPAETALDDYRALDEALEAAFGRRRFVALPVDPDTFYKET